MNISPLGVTAGVITVGVGALVWVKRRPLIDFTRTYYSEFFGKEKGVVYVEGRKLQMLAADWIENTIYVACNNTVYITNTSFTGKYWDQSGKQLGNDFRKDLTMNLI